MNYDKLGLANYEAMEAFVRWKFLWDVSWVLRFEEFGICSLQKSRSKPEFLLGNTFRGRLRIMVWWGVGNPETTNDNIILDLPTILEEGIILALENEIIANIATIDGFTMNVSPEIVLRIIGYDTSDRESAIKAFKLHFIQKDINSVLSDGELKILNNLYKKYS